MQFESDAGPSTSIMPSRTRRHRFVRWGAYATLALLAVSLPFELNALRNSDATASKEALLPAAGIHLGTAPIVVFGPDGRNAAQQFAGPQWIPRAAISLCRQFAKTSVAATIEVGFVWTKTGPRAVMADYCPLEIGGERLLVALYRPKATLGALLVSAASHAYSATVIMTPTSVTISGEHVVARYGAPKSLPSTTLTRFTG